MIGKVAVFVNKHNITVSMDEAGSFSIYEKEMDIWTKRDYIPFEMKPELGIAGVRNQMKELAILLEDVDIIIAEKIIGLAYTILDPKGFELWEVEGNPDDFLEDVMSEAEKAISEVDSKEWIAPSKINDDGCYFINLKDVMKKTENSISSKEILMPFLSEGKFYELNVVCSHVPPWFEKQIPFFGLVMEVKETSPGEKEVRIVHKTCAN